MRLPSELKNKYPEKILLRVVKPFYSFIKLRIYWFETYLKHYQQKLHIKLSLFNLYFLISDTELFGITGLQINNTLNVGTMEFLAAKNKAFVKAGIKIRP